VTMLNEILKKKEKVFSKFGENVNIDSVMLESNGKVESHFFKEDDLHEMRSVSKVLVALAFGIAIDRKFLFNGKPLTLKTPVYPAIKHLAQIKTVGNLEKIEKWTIETLLQYSAGWDRQIFSRKEIEGLDEKNYLEYILNVPIENEPNEKYVYNNAEIFLLSVFFQEAFGMNLTEFVAKEIFSPLEIERYKWKNYDKYCPGGTGLYISHKDFFKIGQMILWGGKLRRINRLFQKNGLKKCAVFNLTHHMQLNMKGFCQRLEWGL